MRYGVVSLFLWGLSLSGCYRGYKDASDLEADNRGPSACAKSCKDLGMRMSAFVLVESTTSACVCSPAATTGETDDAAAAASAAHVLLEQQRQATEQQQAQSSKPSY